MLTGSSCFMNAHGLAIQGQPSRSWKRCFAAARGRGPVPKASCSSHVGSSCCYTKAVAEERAAATASVIKWTSWLTERPGSSLKRLHRFTRVATGWTESADSKGEEDESGEEDDLDGLSREQLLAI